MAVRKLPSVETLGCTTVICSDKTGTLTTNKMSAVSLAILTDDQDGDDFVFDEYSLNAKPSKPHRLDMGIDTFNIAKVIIPDVIDASVLCNDAEIVAKNKGNIWNGQFSIIGEPTEGSLMVLASKLGQSGHLQPNSLECVRKIRTDCEKLDTYIETSMSTLCKKTNGRHCLFVKGAPSMVLDRCSHIKLHDGRSVEINSVMRQKIERTLRAMSSRPLRCLLLAMKDMW